ncbi:MAG TPA: N-acetylglucosamine-6-phosphate deacetylase [Bacillota bacterium]|nr:N-acetylglucosamine-6-phosphate deacetylase [Bacillota bacterium]
MDKSSKIGETNPIYIKNITIFMENEKVEDGSLYIENGIIQGIYHHTESIENLPENTYVIDGSELNAIPGFIDGHIHGAAGSDVMDATEEALDAMASVLPKEGTTSFLATTITQSPENIDRALENVAVYQTKAGQAEIVGVHLEGPFIASEKAGAQPLEYMMKPNMEQFEHWQRCADNKIKTITLAPELDDDGVIQKLSEMGINVSAGHTSASFADMKQAVKKGVHQLTHLCNAMEGIHHRDDGEVGAAFQLDKLRAELIADGIHVSPEMLQIIYNNVGSERLLLITDAMRAKCMPPGVYDLGGQNVYVTEDRATLENKSLAGSILKLNDGAKRMLSLEGVTIPDIIEMTAVNPAKQIHMYDRKGSIATGKDADVLLVNDQLDVKYTICNGVIAFKEE